MKKFSQWLGESLAKREQLDDAIRAAMALSYQGIDVENASSKEIEDALLAMGKTPPLNTSMGLFVARIKSAVRGTVVPDDFSKNPFR